MNEPTRFGIIGGIAGHRWFVHVSERVRCECGATFHNRSGLAAHVRLAELLAPATESGRAR